MSSPYVERIITTVDDGGCTLAINKYPNGNWAFIVTNIEGEVWFDDAYQEKEEAFAAYFEQLSCDHLMDDTYIQKKDSYQYKVTEAEATLHILLTKQERWKDAQTSK